MTTKSKPINYLANRNILAEIHKSKISYCSYQDDAHTSYDIICTLTEVTLEHAVQIASRPVRANALRASHSVPDEVVFRVMTYDHIPMRREDERFSKHTVNTEIPFQSFKHYIVRDNVPVEVLRSHWVGGFDNGHFSITHGTMTRMLGKMMILLVQKYAQRGNWRGYSYNDEMQQEALVHLSNVLLKFNEAKSDNPFSYMTQIVTNSFKRTWNAEHTHEVLRDELTVEAGYSGYAKLRQEI